jgi:hypothetical protein
MKPSMLAILLVGLSGCVSQPIPEPPARSLAPATAPVFVADRPPEVQPAHVASVVKAYRAIERQEVPAVIAEDVTPDYIHRIHIADLAARRALWALERSDRRPTLADLMRARDAVNHLALVLQEPRGGSTTP